MSVIVGPYSDEQKAEEMRGFDDATEALLVDEDAEMGARHFRPLYGCATCTPQPTRCGVCARLFDAYQAGWAEGASK